MAPRRRPANVVRSGNAGNSSKPTSKDKEKDAKSSTPDNAPFGTFKDGTPRPPPLFPAGYKSPVTILNEKCQKMGWEKPVVESVSVKKLFERVLLDHNRFSKMNIRGLLADMQYLLVAANSTVSK